MSTYTWEYGAADSGLHFTITYDDSAQTFTVNVLEGAFDLNALWFSNGDGEGGDITLSKKENSLNVNGTDVEWDDYYKVSDTGLGKAGESKDSYLSADGVDSMTLDLADLQLDLGDGPIDWASVTLGVRATSVSGGDSDSFKLVDTEPVVVNDEPNYFTFEFGNDPLNIVADAEDYIDNTGAENFDGVAGASGESGNDLSFTQGQGDGGGANNFNETTVTADDGDPGDPGDPGLDAYVITNSEPYDGIKIISGGTGPNSILGGAGGAGGSAGDGGSIVVTSTGNASENTLTGGDGGDGGMGGDGGHAIINGELNVVIIEGDQDLIVLGGDGGQGGSGGAGGDVSVAGGTDGGGNAPNNTLTAGDGGDGGDGGAGGDGSVGGDGGDGGEATVTAPGNTSGNTETDGVAGNSGASTGLIAAFSDRVDVDASAFTGYLTISGSDDDDTMVMGSGGSLIYDTLGADTYTLGSGVDVVNFTFMESDIDTVIDFTVGGGGDVLSIADLLVGYEDGVSDIADFVQLVDDSTNTIVMVDADGGGDNNFQDVVVLQGVTGFDLNTLLSTSNIDVI